MRYVIRKVPERDTSYLERLLPDALIYNDTAHIGALYSFFEAMKVAHDDAVYIQDDMVLCKDFRARCDLEISKRPNDVITLCNNTFVRNHLMVLTERYCKPEECPWLLCTYIPYRISHMLLSDLENGTIKVRKSENKFQQDDVFFGRYMQYIGADPYLVVPNLAGHRFGKSMIKGHDAQVCRVSMNFEYDKAETGLDLRKENEAYFKLKPEYDRFREIQARNRGIV